jgi:uncharacterized membrane protein YkvA (DUF1232 family)
MDKSEPGQPQSAGGALRRWARQLKAEVYALYLAYRDPRTPWYAKIVAALVVGYAFSPLDLIPDFIPVLGQLDDLVLVPLGIALARRLIPPAVMADSRRLADERQLQNRPTNWVAAGVIIGLWLLLAAVAIVIVLRIFG